METIETLLDNIRITSEKVSELATRKMKLLLLRNGEEHTDDMIYLSIDIEFGVRLENTHDGMFIEVDQVRLYPGRNVVVVYFSEYDRVDNFHGDCECDFSELDCFNQAELLRYLQEQVDSKR